MITNTNTNTHKDRFEARRELEINGQAAAYSPQIQIHTNAEEIQI